MCGRKRNDRREEPSEKRLKVCDREKRERLSSFAGHPHEPHCAVYWQQQTCKLGQCKHDIILLYSHHDLLHPFAVPVFFLLLSHACPALSSLTHPFQLIYLRKFKNLSVLNLANNPISAVPEYKTYVMARYEKQNDFCCLRIATDGVRKKNFVCFVVGIVERAEKKLQLFVSEFAICGIWTID